MSGLLPDVDPDGLLEYSVVYTDRALNHMSQRFQEVMRRISSSLKQVYSAHSVAIVPGSGTFAMESVARQFANGQKCLIIRNGWFSYRWSQIMDLGKIPSSSSVLKARPVSPDPNAPFIPPPLSEVQSVIEREKPDLVFAPHVETSAGMILPQEYLAGIAEITHRHGGLFVLDCIASGAIWVDMQDTGVDILISAPQKGWSGSPCCGLVMMGEKATFKLQQTTSSSFSMDLKRWRQIMDAYEKGGHAYHATMPTDSLRILDQTMQETIQTGLSVTMEKQWSLGYNVRSMLEARGFTSVSAEGFQSPGVVVSYTSDPDIKSGKKFLQCGLQIAAGVPLQCDESADFSTFRLGFFGLDKILNPDRTINLLENALDQVMKM